MTKTLYLVTKDFNQAEPLYPDEMPIFSHCTGGSTAVYQHNFKRYAPVFYAHGYVKIILDGVEIGSSPGTDP